MDEVTQVQQLELLCQAFYGGGSKSEQNEAHQVLLPLASNPANVPRLQVILAKSNNLQALLFAAAGLTNLFTKHWSQIAEPLKQDTRNFVLNYLYQRGPDLLQNAPEILGHFVRLLCRIIKLSWLENLANQVSRVYAVAPRDASGTRVLWIVHHVALIFLVGHNSVASIGTS